MHEPYQANGDVRSGREGIWELEINGGLESSQVFFLIPLANPHCAI